MLIKVLITFIIFFNFLLNVSADEKKNIIANLAEIDNLTFNFEQITNEKTEIGNCVVKFNNKLKCNYDDKLQKEIIINDKTLAILQKKFDKIYLYPVSKSPFMIILNKEKLINLIQKSDLILNEDIELVYIDENQKEISIFFEKKNYELKGWLIKDEFQNEIYFSLKIQKINSELDKNYFDIPTIN